MSWANCALCGITRVECGYGVGHGGLLCLPGTGCRSRQCRTGISSGARSGAPSQCASAVLMVRPKAFGYNAQTAVTNRFQSRVAKPGSSAEVAQRALREFDAFAAALTGRGRHGVRGRGFGQPAQARRRVPEQLGELPRATAPSCCIPCTPKTGAPSAARKSSTRWSSGHGLQGHARARSHPS